MCIFQVKYIHRRREFVLNRRCTVQSKIQNFKVNVFFFHSYLRFHTRFNRIYAFFIPPFPLTRVALLFEAIWRFVYDMHRCRKIRVEIKTGRNTFYNKKSES